MDQHSFSRRDFLRTAGKGLLGVTVASVLPVSLSKAESEAPVEAPAWPWKWQKLDPAVVLDAGYKAFYSHGGCAAGCVASVLETLAAEYGYPYNQINARMFADGAGGYGVQSLCGSLGGACALFGLFCESKDAGALRNELYAWYRVTPFPNYQPELTSPTTTVADSVECRDSVGKYMAATGFTMADDGRKARCAAVTGEVAAKVVELLNVHFGFAEAAPVVEEPAPELADNEYLGESKTEHGKVRVKVTMDGDKIANIEVLDHSETSGISDPAFDSVIPAILSAGNTTVETVSGATQTSNALIEAVNDALSKVGK